MIDFLSLDEYLSLNIALNNYNSLFHIISLILAQVFDFMTIFFFFLILAFFTKKRKHTMFLIILTTSTAIGYILKLIVQRSRPYFFGITNYANSLGYSFPSGHSIVAFALAFYYAKDKSVQAKLNFYGLAMLVALSRVVLGVHYLSDVIAGACISMFIVSLYFWKEKEINKRINKFLKIMIKRI